MPEGTEVAGSRHRETAVDVEYHTVVVVVVVAVADVAVVAVVAAAVQTVTRDQTGC